MAARLPMASYNHVSGVEVVEAVKVRAEGFPRFRPAGAQAANNRGLRLVRRASEGVVVPLPIPTISDQPYLAK